VTNDDAEIERLKADAYAALKNLVAILRSQSSVDDKRAALLDAYSKETRSSDCVDRKCAESFAENPAGARTTSMADTALNLLGHLLNFFVVVRCHRASLGFSETSFEPNPASFSNMQRLVGAYYPERAKKLRGDFASGNLPTHGFDNPFPPPPMPPAKVPAWFAVVGAFFGGLTLLFLMALVASEVIGHPVPPNGRFLVVAVLGLGAALSGGFLGGDAATKGNIPLPFAKEHPIAFSASGGVAILVIVLLIGYYVYVRPNPPHAFTVLGNRDLQKSENLTYDSVVIPRDTVIQTNGHDLFMTVNDDMNVEGEALIEAFDYESVAKNNRAGVDGKPGADGLNYIGSASNVGAQGRDGGDGQPGQPGVNGAAGKSAGQITLTVNGKAHGALRVLNRGTNGQPGGNGGRGGNGGHGEGGGPGASSGSAEYFLTGRHMGAGGRGGNGGRGGDAGHGGDGGNGGSVTIYIARNIGFVLKELDTIGGESGTGGKPGRGGSPGQPGGGHGNRGTGRPGENGSPANGSPTNGKSGRVELHGVQAPESHTVTTLQ
jgi:hypothetical protein